MSMGSVVEPLRIWQRQDLCQPHPKILFLLPPPQPIQATSLTVPIYARLVEQGRVLPDGLRYVESWVEANFDRCFQLMECDDALLLQRWVLQWRDLVAFEIVPVSPSQAVRELILAAGEGSD